MTTVYLVRHSEPFRDLEGETKSRDSLLLINEKYILGVRGEKLAEKVANNPEFDNIDVVWASNYVRAMSTAKYFAYRNNTRVNIDERFKEREQGVLTWDELPKDYYINQLKDENYKFRDGECQKEVAQRMREALFDVVKNNNGKRIVIVSHNAALTFLLKTLCDVSLDESKKALRFSFNNELVYIGSLNYCETVKLEFDDQYNLCSLSHININE